jgi:hypothetical protein
VPLRARFAACIDEYLGTFGKTTVPVKNANLDTGRATGKGYELNPAARDAEDEFAHDCRSASALNGGNTLSSFLNLRVVDIKRCYELWRSRGAHFITEPKVHETELRCYMRDPDGYLIEVGQTTITATPLELYR